MLYSFFGNGGVGFINRRGNVVVSPKFMFVGDSSEGLINYNCGICGYGYIDEKGNIYSLSVDGTSSFHEGLAAVRIHKSYGYVNKKFNFIIEPKFDFAADFSEGLAAVKLNDKFGFVDRKGNVAIELQFDCVREFSEGLSAVKVGGKWGFIDKRGKPVIDAVYESAESFKKGTAIIKVNGKYGFIDKSGRMTVAPQFEYVSQFNGGIEGNYAAAKIDVKYGFIDTCGKFVIEPQFDDAASFKNGFGTVCMNKQKDGSEGSTKKWTYIDMYGKLLTDYIFDYTWGFQNEFAVVQVDEGCGLIDARGNFLIEPEYDEIKVYEDGLIVVEKDFESGYTDRDLGFEIKPIIVTESDIEVIDDGETVIWKR